eukprot:5405087-Pyramimonas_sp.AAC.1
MGLEDRAASLPHRRCIASASATFAMSRRRRRGEHRAPHRAASPMHQRCGAILRPHLCASLRAIWR